MLTQYSIASLTMETKGPQKWGEEMTTTGAVSGNLPGQPRLTGVHEPACPFLAVRAGSAIYDASTGGPN